LAPQLGLDCGGDGRVVGAVDLQVLGLTGPSFVDSSNIAATLPFVQNNTR
jgi:hypothetical protein